MKTIHEEVLIFLNEVASMKVDDLDINSSIEIDLGITGDNADELIHSFSDRFNVDVTGFKVDRYFHSEPGLFSFKTESEKMEFSIKDMILAAETKILL